jgi:hypothetical protein
MTTEREWTVDPDKLPKKLEIELSDAAKRWLEQAAAKTGRSEDELILELLDKGLQNS